jgi:hypothetical protein
MTRRHLVMVWLTPSHCWTRYQQIKIELSYRTSTAKGKKNSWIKC